MSAVGDVLGEGVEQSWAREGERVLDLRGVSAGYGRSTVLHEISLDVRAREIVVLLGANGAGKTTLMRAIVGSINSHGARYLGKANISGRGPSELARSGVASVPQGRGTFNELTVEDNLRLGALLLPRERREDALESWFERFPRLAERRKVSAGVLSGGEQQMLAIARACIGEPRLLLCDEPSLGLSPGMTLQVFETFSELNASLGFAMLIVEQNAKLALSVADHASVLESGRIVWEGRPSALDNDETLARAYLGSSEG